MSPSFASASITASAWLLSSACVLLGACTVGPDYVKPTATTAATYKELEGSGWKPIQPADTVPRGAWWSVYADPSLDALEQQVASANQNVQAVEARFRAARVTVTQYRSSFFPVVSANGDYSRACYSSNVLHKSTAGLTLNDYLVQADASWEPDLWGRVSRSVEGAKAEAPGKRHGHSGRAAVDASRTRNRLFRTARPRSGTPGYCRSASNSIGDAASSSWRYAICFNAAQRSGETKPGTTTKP